MAERRLARLPVTPAATAQAAAYRAALTPLLDELERLVERLLRELTPALGRTDSRSDASALTATLRKLLGSFADALGGEFEALLERVEKMLRARAVQVDRVGLATLERQVKAAIRVSPRLPKDALATVMSRATDQVEARTATRDEWLDANVDLIRGLSDRAVERVSELVREAARGGTRIQTLAQQLREQVGVSRRRADLLARDQTTKLAAQFNEAQQRDLGARRYVWRHSGVRQGARPEHLARDGRVFRWDAPPADGHPGAAPNCRCTAEPLVEELLGTVM